MVWSPPLAVTRSSEMSGYQHDILQSRILDIFHGDILTEHRKVHIWK